MSKGRTKSHGEVIGTRSGAAWHRNRGQPVCDPCMQGEKIYHSEWRDRGKCAPGLGWPLSLKRSRPYVRKQNG